MAKTAKGRSLTASFQRNNRVLADRAGLRLRESWSLLNPYDVWGTADDWLFEVARVAQEAYGQSQRLAHPYLRDFAQAERFTLPQNLPTEPLDVAAFKEDMRYRGPRVIMEKVSSGVLPVVAKNSTLQRLQDTVAMWVQDGGRGVIIGASKYSGRSGRWRRVASGIQPCTFCAMLAGRGPVYTAQTVTFESHPGCNCSAELVDGDWEPTELEHLWRQVYDEAATRADEAGQLRIAPSRRARDQDRDNILWRMRRIAPGAFSDGVYPKV